MYRLSLLARRRTLRSTLVVAVGLLSGWFALQITGDVAAARHRLGTTTRVVVLTADIAAGEPLTAGDVRLEDRPVAFVPADALTEPPLERALRVDGYAGEVLVAGRLAGAGRTGARAQVPAGWRAVTVPVAAGAGPPVTAGDVVDVIASFDPLVADEPSVVVATGAVVVHVDDDAVTVAVPAELVTDVAFATTTAAVTVALVG